MCRQGNLLDVSVPQVEDDPLVYEAMLKIVRNDFNGAQDCIERVSGRSKPPLKCGDFTTAAHASRGRV